MKLAKNLKVALAVGAVTAAGSASAVIDVAAVLTAMGDAAAPIASIGAASLIIVVGVKVWAWIRSAIR